MTHERIEEVRIAVSFGDISGSSDTYDRLTSPKKELGPFFTRFDAFIARASKESGFEFVDTGDGYMAIIDLDSGHNCDKALRLLGAVCKLNEEVNKEIAAMDDPRFLGFRTRLAAGYVLRKVKKDGKIVHRGKPINLAHNLLQVSPRSLMIGHESFRALATSEQWARGGFNIRHLAPPRKRPESISDKDAAMLYVFERIEKK